MFKLNSKPIKSMIVLMGISFVGLHAAKASESDLNQHLDLNNDQMFIAPTAMSAPGKGFSFHTLDGVFWNFNYKLSNTIDVGLQTSLPVGFFLASPHIRYHTELSPGVHVGLFGTVGYFNFFLFEVYEGVLTEEDDKFGVHVFYAGGGPLLSFGDAKKSLNFSFQTYGSKKIDSGVFFLPSIGGLYQFANHFKLNVEVLPIFNSNKFVFGSILGIRWFGKKLYGDVGLGISPSKVSPAITFGGVF